MLYFSVFFSLRNLSGSFVLGQFLYLSIYTDNQTHYDHIVGLVVGTKAISCMERLLQNDFYCNKNTAMIHCYSSACVLYNAIIG